MLSTQCYTCAGDYDGTKCLGCSPSCKTCTSDQNYCTDCPSGQYLLSNGTCSSTCPSFFIAGTFGSMNTCSSPCSSGQYLYWDQSCAATCNAPLTMSTYAADNLCNYPCNNADFLYWN